MYESGSTLEVAVPVECRLPRPGAGYCCIASHHPAPAHPFRYIPVQTTCLCRSQLLSTLNRQNLRPRIKRLRRMSTHLRPAQRSCLNANYYKHQHYIKIIVWVQVFTYRWSVIYGTENKYEFPKTCPAAFLEWQRNKNDIYEDVPRGLGYHSLNAAAYFEAVEVSICNEILKLKFIFASVDRWCVRT